MIALPIPAPPTAVAGCVISTQQSLYQLEQVDSLVQEECFVILRSTLANLCAVTPYPVASGLAVPFRVV